ncbi:hypothetical protein GGI07_005612 [Coemansia sp. Benny D115]|nr:hypothetical protein GGI07_005612 [Coemansia sp. Benny D115]
MGFSKVTEIIRGMGQLLVTGIASSASYLWHGPMVASWDYRTQLSRDIVVHVGYYQRSSVLNLIEWHRQRHDARVWSIETLQVPAYKLQPSHVENAGMWGDKLLAIQQQCFAEGGASERPYYVTMDRVSERAANESCRAILYFHGGAYVIGNPVTYRPPTMELSRRSGMPVFVVGYRLAPDTQYPGQLYDAYCALQCLVEQGYSLGDIIFAGDSAGGNLALALWRLTRSPIRGMALLSPRVDISSERPSWKLNAAVDIIAAYDIHKVGSPLYSLIAEEDRENVLQDPFLAPVYGSSQGLPPTLVQAGSVEVMLDDVKEFVARAPHQSITFRLYEGGFHVFQYAPMTVVGSRQAWDDLEAFIRGLEA